MKKGSSLLWRCRRGIREMDILLQRFIEKHYDDLSSEEKQNFELLLEQQDLDILAWILGKSEPPTREFTHLTRLIRNVSSPVDEH
jgi:antitoxin CptB